MRWQGWRVVRWEPHRLDMGRYLTLQECLERGGRPPNLMTQDVLGRASAMHALHPIHPIDRYLYRRVSRAGTDSRLCPHAQEPSARRIGVDQATQSHFDDACHSKTLHCGIVRLREDWLDMDCVARKCETDCERSHWPRGYSRHTCFKSESISSSFCLSCASRYSRLLKDKMSIHPRQGRKLKVKMRGKGRFAAYGDEVVGRGQGKQIFRSS
jgi:hypothetical protein